MNCDSKHVRLQLDIIITLSNIRTCQSNLISKHYENRTKKSSETKNKLNFVTIYQIEMIQLAVALFGFSAR